MRRTFVLQLSAQGNGYRLTHQLAWADPMRQTHLWVHDILDHSYEDTGTFEQEMVALATGYLWRGVYSKRYPVVTIGDMLADISSFYSELLRKLSIVDGRSVVEDAPVIPSVLTVKMVDLLTDLELEFLSRGWNQEDLHKVRGWLRYGFYVAMQRYPNEAAAAELYRRLHAELEHDRRVMFTSQHSKFIDVVIDIDACRLVEIRRISA